MRFFGMERDFADVDLFINRVRRNVQNIQAALKELGEILNFPIEALEHPNKQLRLSHYGMQLDIFTSFDAIDFGQAYKRAIEAEEQRVPIRVVAPADLFVIKE